ncbi:MAG: Coenzyme F420 hydrogenase/dehydrogenase, beta subunit C-terminal domain [Rikenellaceae bacterium]
MIDIQDKFKCCGCEACAQICPVAAIELVRDSEGFLYPQVNIEECIDCSLCERVCPELVQLSARKPLRVLAAQSCDETIRAESSSGGLFSELAQMVIRRGGVVFAARYNPQWEVEHMICDNIEGIDALRRSKYSQSRMGTAYIEAREALESGREVLFVGTPCHISALYLFLRREYSNLTTVDFLCHGVPSPLIWRHYLESLGVDITSVSQRDKSNGWRRYSVRIEGSKADGSHFEQCKKFYNDPFNCGFLRDLYLRPSCHKCPSKSFSSGSDITLADFWGVEKFFPKDDDKGCNMLITHSKRGEELVAKLTNCKIEESNAKAIQQIAYSSPKLTSKRKRFFERFQAGEPFDQIIESLTKAPLYKKITRPISRFLEGVVRRKS